MPISGFTIGRDVAININLPNGPAKFSNVTDFQAKQITKGLESKGIDGVDRFGEIPAGWEGHVEIDRADSNMDLAFGYLETLYYAGQNVPNSTVTETITEPSGNITQWRFDGVAFKFDEHGSWKGDSKVTQKLSWKASKRIQVI
jgi:hypothetical protein